jgi:hypothetical protein
VKTQALMTFEIAAGLTSILQPLGCIASTRQLAVFTIFRTCRGQLAPSFLDTDPFGAAQIPSLLSKT